MLHNGLERLTLMIMTSWTEQEMAQLSCEAAPLPGGPRLTRRCLRSDPSACPLTRR